MANEKVNKVIDRNGNVLIDLTNDTVSPGKVLQGTKFHGADGKEYTGALSQESIDLKYRFIDYDGTIMYSFTDEEIDAMSELPAGPDHTDENLTFQEWNWTLEDLKSWDKTRLTRPIVGASMITTDGKTYITIEIKANKNFGINYCIPTSNESPCEFSIDWGDGTTIDLTHKSTYSATKSHKYAEDGIYDIVITVNSGRLVLGSTGGISSSSYLKYIKSIKIGNIAYLGGLTQTGKVGINAIKAINIPAGAIVPPEGNETSPLCSYLSLEGLVVPRGFKNDKLYLFDYSSIDRVSLPNGFTYWDSQPYCIKEMPLSLGNIPAPNSNYTIYNYCGNILELFATNFESLSISSCLPVRYLRIYRASGSISIFNLPSLKSIEFIDCTFTSIKYLTDAKALEKLVLPDSVTSIGGSNAFNGCPSLTLDLSQQTKVISLTAGIGFSTNDDSNNKILVPKALLEDYKSATYWSNYADIMVGV